MESTRAINDARRLAGSYSPLPPPEARPVIIVTSGLPGTGKSFFSRRLAERLNYVIVESDAIRKKLFRKLSYSAVESASLFRVIHHLIEDLLGKGVSVILDATNLIERHRAVIYRIAERADAKLILVRVDAPPGLVQKRLAARTKRPGIHGHSEADREVYRKMKGEAERIARRHYTVDTSRDITPAIDKIVKEATRGKETDSGN